MLFNRSRDKQDQLYTLIDHAVNAKCQIKVIQIIFAWFHVLLNIVVFTLCSIMTMSIL